MFSLDSSHRLLCSCWSRDVEVGLPRTEDVSSVSSWKPPFLPLARLQDLTAAFGRKIQIPRPIPIVFATTHKRRQIAQKYPVKRQLCHEDIHTRDRVERSPQHQSTTGDLLWSDWSRSTGFLYRGNYDRKGEGGRVSWRAKP